MTHDLTILFVLRMCTDLMACRTENELNKQLDFQKLPFIKILTKLTLRTVLERTNSSIKSQFKNAAKRCLTLKG